MQRPFAIKLCLKAVFWGEQGVISLFLPLGTVTGSKVEGEQKGIKKIRITMDNGISQKPFYTSFVVLCIYKKAC